MEGPTNVDTASNDASFKQATLLTHLDVQYSIKINTLTALDLGVFRVDRQDGPPWVVRVFTPSRPKTIVQGDAEILRLLEEKGFPAERCAHPDPVSTMDTGHNVLVTEFAEGRRARKGEQIFRRLGDLLGQLHTMEFSASEAASRRGGAWHHLCNEGGPREEIRDILSLLAIAKGCVPAHEVSRFEELESKFLNRDDFEDLPKAFVHPDLVPSNVITKSNDDLVVVDWAGVGTGPRIYSLAFLLFAAGCRSMAQVKEVMTSYWSHIQLEEAELARLAKAISLRPLVLTTWEFCTGRKTFSDAMQGISEIEDLAVKIASRIRQALAK